MKRIISFFIAFVMMITLTACGSSSAGGKETPEYYGTYEITGFIINGSETDEEMTAQIKTELEKQGSAFTVTFGDKNYLTNSGNNYPFDIDWDKKIITEKGSSDVMNFDYQDGVLKIIEESSGVTFILTRTE